MIACKSTSIEVERKKKGVRRLACVVAAVFVCTGRQWVVNR